MEVKAGDVDSLYDLEVVPVNSVFFLLFGLFSIGYGLFNSSLRLYDPQVMLILLRLSLVLLVSIPLTALLEYDRRIGGIVTIFSSVGSAILLREEDLILVDKVSEVLKQMVVGPHEFKLVFRLFVKEILAFQLFIQFLQELLAIKSDERCGLLDYIILKK